MSENEFREIYRQYYRLVIKSANSVLHDIDYAHDVMQEVFLLFLEKADEIEECYYTEWFAVYARRKAIDFCRKSYQKHEVISADYADEKSSDKTAKGTGHCKRQREFYGDKMSQDIVTKEFTRKLLADLSAYNKDWYEIMVRSQIVGESDAEIARALGITVINLRTKRHRMKEWLKKYYNSEYESL